MVRQMCTELELREGDIGWVLHSEALSDLVERDELVTAMTPETMERTNASV